jgi:hypothetical protein
LSENASLDAGALQPRSVPCVGIAFLKAFHFKANATDEPQLYNLELANPKLPKLILSEYNWC